MSMSNTSETALLNLLFNNVDWADIGDAAGLQNSATAGSFYVRLHSSDPRRYGHGRHERNQLHRLLPGCCVRVLQVVGLSPAIR